MDYFNKAHEQIFGYMVNNISNALHIQFWPIIESSTRNNLLKEIRINKGQRLAEPKSSVFHEIATGAN